MMSSNVVDNMAQAICPLCFLSMFSTQHSYVDLGHRETALFEELFLFSLFSYVGISTLEVAGKKRQSSLWVKVKLGSTDES